MTLRKKTDLFVVHVTATPPSQDIGVKEVRVMHKARGFSDVGYHFVIRRDGRIEHGRPEREIGAHVAGWNSCSIGVSMVGGVDAKGKPENNATEAQVRALESLLSDLSIRYPDAKICGHRDLSPDGDRDGVIEPAEWIKACPCFDAIPWALSKGLPGADIRGTWSKTAPPPPMAPDLSSLGAQKLLQRAGYQFGPLDGIVGKRTKAAIKGFQIANGLPRTGEFDKATVHRLQAVTAPKQAA